MKSALFISSSDLVNEKIPDDGEPDITNSIAMRQMFNAASMIRYLETTDFLGLPKSARRIGL